MSDTPARKPPQAARSEPQASEGGPLQDEPPQAARSEPQASEGGPLQDEPPQAARSEPQASEGGPLQGCHGFEADLSALLDGELAPERSAELRAHIGACPACSARLAELARVDAALSAAALPAVPASLRARLEARLAGQGDTRLRRTRRLDAPRRAWRIRAAGALAAAAAVAALYLAVATREPARPETAPPPPQIARPQTAPAPAQIARPLEAAPPEIPREVPQAVAKLPAPAPPAPILPEPPPVPAPQPAELDLAAVPDDEIGLALEIETVEDLEVIGNLELLELVLASEAG